MPAKPRRTKADRLLTAAYKQLGLTNASSQNKYDRIDEIVSWLAKRNSRSRIAVATTGTITERLCGLALEGYLGDGCFETLPQQWKWLADFSILGRPLNVLVSVKSFKAKERLLMSGSGVLLAPTIGFGLFDDPSEWRVPRLHNYVLRGFVSIYMPEPLYVRVKESQPEAARFRNLNSNRFLRPLEAFGRDLAKAKLEGRIDPTLL